MHYHCPIMLTKPQCQAFADQGYLVVPDVVAQATLADLRDDYARRVADLLTRGKRLGRLSDTPPPADFAAAVTELICGWPEGYQHLDISLPMDEHLAQQRSAWQALFGDNWRDEAGLFAGGSVYRLLTCPGIAGIARQLLGPEVQISPVQHARIKPPQHLLPAAAAQDANVARTLWHQDEAVVHEGAHEVSILTVWVAVTEATPENGCMYCVPGSHLAGRAEEADFGLQTHCPGKVLVGEIYIPDQSIPQDNLVPLVAAPGDVVLLHQRTVHGAGANRSDDLRWSFDLRYQPANTPTGRECFPACPLEDSTPEAARAYRRRWLDARDAILNGDLAPVFNERWLKYQNAPLCA